MIRIQIFIWLGSSLGDFGLVTILNIPHSPHCSYEHKMGGGNHVSFPEFLGGRIRWKGQLNLLFQGILSKQILGLRPQSYTKLLKWKLGLVTAWQQLNRLLFSWWCYLSLFVSMLWKLLTKPLLKERISPPQAACNPSISCLSVIYQLLVCLYCVCVCARLEAIVTYSDPYCGLGIYQRGA